jgi:hypothetical protein
MSDRELPDYLKDFIIKFVMLNVYIILIIIFLCLVIIKFYM